MYQKTLKKKIIISLCLGIAFCAISYYLILPAINIYDVGFWFYLAAVIFSFSVPFLFKKGEASQTDKPKKIKVVNIGGKESHGKLNFIPIILIAIPVAVVLVGSLLSKRTVSFFLKVF